MSTPFDLILAASRGDTQAFRSLVESHQRLVYTLAFRFVRNAEDAEDITQEVFIRLWRNLGKYDHRQGKLSTWLYGITTNCCLDFERSAGRKVRKKWIALDESYGLTTSTPADGELESRELHGVVLQAATSLPPKQRLAFILRDMEGLTPEETGQALGMTTAQVKSNLFNARQKLATILRKDFQSNIKTRLI